MMERFTIRNADGSVSPRFGRAGSLLDRLAAYEDTGLTPEDLRSTFSRSGVIRLAARALDVEPARLYELARADRDGRLVVYARWISVDLYGDEPYCCTACGASVSDCSYKFCPRCGERMDREAVPVVHAHWVPVDLHGDEQPYCCSACGTGAGDRNYRFCPSCGAKMDGRDGNETD